MQKWDYHMRMVLLYKYKKNKKGEWEPVSIGEKLPDSTTIWDAPWKEQTEFQYIKEMGLKGWEMVSATPISGGIFQGSNYTNELLFIFKRPIEE